MAGAPVILYAEALPAWASAAPGSRCPALESLISRGLALPPLPDGPEAARMTLLGADSPDRAPAGALTACAAAGERVDGHWLRADPVTLSASMSQVYLSGAGLDGFDAAERTALAAAVSAELEQHGLQFVRRVSAGGGEDWAVRLPCAPDAEFTPLHRALGADIADQLPPGPAGLPWRRLSNELQMILHHHPVNAGRRASGRPVINGIWLWGDGPAPSPALAGGPATVISDHSISAGLARCYGGELQPFGEVDEVVSTAVRAIGQGTGPVFIDWAGTSSEAEGQLQALDQAVARLDRVATLAIYGGRRGFQARHGWRGAWWRRSRPVADVFAVEAAA
ncbi:hypothetical protein [Elongatibacter sediminis]|uniref:Phosphoglycerate mutase n=1 Tax=Elongatibacter sediminis TaxID=3119006 RepID=A0AAW9R740_9GAMM